MGVPLVSLRGERHSGRVDASLLTSAGLSDCIAETSGDYIGNAAALACDVARLRNLRTGLRAQLLRPPTVRRVSSNPRCSRSGSAGSLQS
jgi:protein O-GlcNAc transferase